MRQLSEAPSIQVLNVAHNHLPVLDSVSQLPLLQSLDARDNNLLSVSADVSSLLPANVVSDLSIVCAQKVHVLVKKCAKLVSRLVLALVDFLLKVTVFMSWLVTVHYLNKGNLPNGIISFKK